MLGTGIEKIILVIGILGWQKSPESCARNFSPFASANSLSPARAIGASHAKVIFSGNSPNAISAGSGSGVDFRSRGRFSRGGIEFSRFRRSNLLRLGLLLSRAQERISASVWGWRCFPAWRFPCSCCAINLFGDGDQRTCSIPSSEKVAVIFPPSAAQSNKITPQPSRHLTSGMASRQAGDFVR